MEKPRETQPSLSRKAAALLASASLATVYGITTPVEYTPERTECGDPIEAIAPYSYIERLSDISARDILSENKLTAHLDLIEETYGIPIVIAEAPTVETAPKLAVTLKGILNGFEEASPALTNTLAIQRLTVLPEIDPDNTSIKGKYFGSQNEIAIKYASAKSAASVTVHELIGHAVDFTLLCPNDPKTDSAMSQHDSLLDTEPPGLIEEALDSTTYSVSENRLFANSYAATNALEDRATQIQWLFYERGIIRPEDPDYDSPFASKQAEILRRLEMLLPGITTHLESKTDTLRIGLTELEKSIDNPYEPGETANAIAILTHAQQNDLPVEQLRNTTATISLPGQESIIVKNPVVIRDSQNAIKAIAWTPIMGTINSSLETQYYLKEYVDIHYTETSYSYEGYIDTTSANGTGFIQGGLSVDGVWSKEFKQPN